MMLNNNRFSRTSTIIYVSVDRIISLKLQGVILPSSDKDMKISSAKYPQCMWCVSACQLSGKMSLLYEDRFKLCQTPEQKVLRTLKLGSCNWHMLGLEPRSLIYFLFVNSESE